jgi:hypothetical protein
MLALILREEVGGMREFWDELESEAGTSRYADPEADGIIEVCRTNR